VAAKNKDVAPKIYVMDFVVAKNCNDKSF
jgi:hypothetical protein